MRMAFALMTLRERCLRTSASEIAASLAAAIGGITRMQTALLPRPSIAASRLNDTRGERNSVLMPGRTPRATDVTEKAISRGI